MKVGTLGVLKAGDADDLKLHDSWHEGNDDGAIVPTQAGQGLPGNGATTSGSGGGGGGGTSIHDYIIGKQVGTHYHDSQYVLMQESFDVDFNL